MNTNAVSRLLGVSSSTVGRWVKQLGLEMERNEFGHYIYTEEDIEMLKNFKEQIQNGVPVQSIQIKKIPRRGSTRIQQKSSTENALMERVRKLEGDLDNKADSVVTYQILQHRREIEELRSQVDKLNIIVEELTTNTNRHEINFAEETNEIQKRRKKNVFKSIFGW